MNSTPGLATILTSTLACGLAPDVAFGLSPHHGLGRATDPDYRHASVFASDLVTNLGLVLAVDLYTRDASGHGFSLAPEDGSGQEATGLVLGTGLGLLIRVENHSALTRTAP